MDANESPQRTKPRLAVSRSSPNSNEVTLLSGGFSVQLLQTGLIGHISVILSDWSQSGLSPAVMHILDSVRKLPGKKANIQLSLSNTIRFNNAPIKLVLSYM